MKKLVAAAVAALAVAAVASVAFAAATPVKAKLVGKNYVIKGTAPTAAGGNVVDEEIIQHGRTVAGNNRYTAPTAANDYHWKVVAPKSELPAGKYLIEFVDETSTGPTYIKFTFTIT